MPATWRLTDKCFAEAEALGADYIVIDMNTYGGVLDVADSIRTRVLNSKIPVVVFINNEAASAGALISVAADSIYIRPGGSIGAATVVNQTGSAMPDKYQSFMRSMMRSTAEAHGKRMTINAKGDTIYTWHRDPLLAEAMVDTRIIVPNLVDSTKVLTLTADEAITWGYAEGKAESVVQVIDLMDIGPYTLTEYKLSAMDKTIGWLTNPMLQGILIMLIIGGIYFELQTPGIGFPLAVSVLAAALYFSPLYIEGMAESWELIVFVVGVILIGVEIFVLPGFGVAGVAGIVLMVGGLTLALVDNELFRYFDSEELGMSVVLNPLLQVIVSVTIAIGGSIYLTSRFLHGKSRIGRRIVLTSQLDVADGFVSSSAGLAALVGCEATVSATLRPSGKVEIDGQYYDAVAEDGMFVDKGTRVVVSREASGNLYCKVL